MNIYGNQDMQLFASGVEYFKNRNEHLLLSKVEIDRIAENLPRVYFLCDRKFLGIPHHTKRYILFYVTENINYDINSIIDENVRKP